MKTVQTVNPAFNFVKIHDDPAAFRASVTLLNQLNGLTFEWKEKKKVAAR